MLEMPAPAQCRRQLSPHWRISEKSFRELDLCSLKRPSISESEDPKPLVLGPKERVQQQLPEKMDMLPSGGGPGRPVKTVT